MRLTRRLSSYVYRKYPNWDVSIALRYLPIIKDLKKKLPKGSRILDVGSGEFGVATYLKGGYEVVGTDIYFGGRRSKDFELVKASADNLPFKDDAFTTTLSVDMMEHLPEKIRKKSVEEMARVTEKYLYLAFPRSSFSASIDRFIARYYEATHKEELDYLKEHIKYGLPEEKEVIKAIKEAARAQGKSVEIKKEGNTNSLLWTTLLLMGFSEIKPITYLYHKMLLLLPILKHLNIWPTYRVIIYAEFN
jgi:ubiquinone/menaquinone biosynthesis C-methylase UbiE